MESCQPDFSLAQLWDCWLVHRHWLVQGSLGALYDDPDKRRWLKPEACWEVEGAAKLSAADVYRASQSRSDWYRALQRLFERYDFLLLPPPKCSLSMHGKPGRGRSMGRKWTLTTAGWKW